jgi:hypothetical protein
MRIVMALLLTLLFLSAHVCFAENTVQLKETTLFGQKRIKADRIVSYGSDYGNDDSKGYYTDNGITYIITYGPPEGGTGKYVIVKRIEQIIKQRTQEGAPTREQILEARREYKIQVVSFDASQEFGIVFPYSDFVRLNITNNSKLMLPTLTLLTKRLDRIGRMIGNSSRVPAIPVGDLRPGQSAEIDYYPRGHLPGVKKITVEIEPLISPEDEQFIKELPSK